MIWDDVAIFLNDGSTLLQLSLRVSGLEYIVKNSSLQELGCVLFLGMDQNKERLKKERASGLYWLGFR